jgi:hypothetical protein
MARRGQAICAANHIRVENPFFAPSNTAFWAVKWTAARTYESMPPSREYAFL